MSSEINAKNKTEPADDLVSRAARFGAFGWLAFFITLFILVLQNIVYALKPPTIMAAEDGVIIGQVVFDEPAMRDIDTVTGDMKKWVQGCVSVNKVTIYEDLALCLNHMSSDLSERRMESYKKINYVPKIANFGCEKTDIQFYDQEISITRYGDQELQKRDDSGRYIEAKMYGAVICEPDAKNPEQQEFKLRVVGELGHRLKTRTLGLTVKTVEDI